MAELIAEFFGVIGVDKTPPHTLAELIPYQLTVNIGMALVTNVFWIFGRLIRTVVDFRRW